MEIGWILDGYEDIGMAAKALRAVRAGGRQDLILPSWLAGWIAGVWSRLSLFGYIGSS